jgi:hypothetical protein
VVRLPYEDIFRDTVEGRPGNLSVEVTDQGVAVVARKPIEDGSPPRPDLIIRLLRSGLPLSQEVRNIIADFIDPAAGTLHCFGPMKRRRRGRHAGWGKWHMDAARLVEERFTARGQYEAAVEEATKKFGLTRSQVTGSYSQLKKVREIERLERDDSEST